MDYHTHTLSNGIRIIHKPEKSEVGYCGIFINTGSRDENEEEHGLAHFIEHVIFKGTKKRRAYHILSRLDDVGGELNAYTTKEETCIYAAFLKDDLKRAIELISDITFHSVFPNKELEKEKEVIIDEINSYKDNPGEQIFDDFEDYIFEGHPLGRNILGTPETLKHFSRQQIEEFMANNYHTDQMVFCSAGNYNFKQILRLLEKHLGEIPANLRTKERKAFDLYQPFNRVLKKDTYQSHVCVGNTAYDLYNTKRLGLHLVNNLMGGPGMNSRLNMALREKSGIAYNIESNYTAYSGTGIINIYFGTDENNIDKSLSIIERELKLIREKQLGEIQLHKAKRQLKGQITISNENKESLMLSLGKSFLLYDKIDSLTEVYEKIDALTATDLLGIANEVFAKEQLSYLIFK